MAKATVSKENIEKIKAKAEIEEGYLVSTLFENPNHYATFTKDDLHGEMFLHDAWRFFFEFGRDMFSDGIQTFDDVIILKKVKEYGIESKFKEYGGYDPINQIIRKVGVSTDNFDDYKRGIRWNHIIKQLKMMFGEKVFVKDGKYDPYKMRAEQLTLYWKDKMNQIHMAASENIFDSSPLLLDAEKYIEEIEKQSEGVMPFYNAKLTNKAVAGWVRGNVFMHGGYGNTGKSSIATEDVVMACIENGEKLVILANEEDRKAWQDKLSMTIKTHYLKDIKFDRKKLVRSGLTEKDKDTIRKIVAKTNELLNGDDRLIQVVYLQSYVIEDVKTMIQHYVARGYINFLIDTHKVSDSKTGESRYAQFVDDTKEYYKLARPDAGGYNLRIFLNFQLAEHTKGRKFLDNDCIGEGKAAKDEAAVVMMFRNVFDDEKMGGKNPLECWKWMPPDDFNDKPIKKEFQLKAGKQYFLKFITKNRFGSTNDGGQEVIVIEPYFNGNTFKEIGYTYVAKTSDSYAKR